MIAPYGYDPKTNQCRCQRCRTVFDGRIPPEHACIPPPARTMICHYRGEPIGTVEIPHCCGGEPIPLTVFACAVHDHCTRDRRVETYGCCNDPMKPCLDYLAAL